MIIKFALKGLAIDGSNRITSHGTFEGEPRYVPYFWQFYLEGVADRDDGKTIGFDVKDYDKVEFPELKHRKTVKICQDLSGFVKET